MDENNQQLYTIILRHDTSTQWAVNNPILTLGEYAVEDDTHRVKRGDGETEWNELPYEEFGLAYLVTYKNLSGEVSDNSNLQKALDEKMSKSVFEDVAYQAISSINMEAEDGAISKITKISKNINNATTDTNMLLIKSTDNSIQGYWSVDDKGVKILNLIAESSITDYEPSHKYYQDQLCYYKNILYRATEDFEAEMDFNPIHWVKLASLNSEDIKYNNLVSGLDSETVKDALDELKRRNDTKVSKSTETKVVYGTTADGQQTVIPMDDLRTVDSVNGKRADDQELKNIQIDSDDINYEDEAPEKGTIKEVLDSKVDKVFAGEGAKILRDVQFNYNEETGHIELIEDKVSPEDSTSTVETTEIDVVSEKELSDATATINAKIDAEHTHFEEKINEVDTRLDKKIDTEVLNLNARVTNEVATLNTKIDTEVRTLNTKIDTEKETLNNRITSEVATLNETITSENTRLDGRIDDLTATVANNKSDIEGKLAEAKEALNTRLDEEVATLNNTINQKETTLLDTITEKHTEINTRVDNEVKTLNTRIDTEVATLNTTIAEQDNLKIDKNIADNIVTGIEVATHDRQPTIKITSKNTESKEAIYDYVHFTTSGKIATRMEDADHLVIDSTEIERDIAQNVTHLTQVDGRLDAHDTEINSLKEHDVVHDKGIATNASQIANHETRVQKLETRADGFDVSIADLNSKIENEITGRKTADAELSTDITRNKLDIATNAENIRLNADNIVKVNELLRTNIETLTNSKIDKSFASEINNKLVGNIEIDDLTGNEIFNIKATKISPVDNSISTDNLKIISSDNTVVAKKLEDGTIDIATNLDTDVNYFVTTQILDTTIPSENTIDMSTLTATDKTELEVQDIITDPEGTWCRVKSIDKEANTCVAVTFKKHAQAVWGTIKGNIEDQQDLINKFTEVKNLIDTNVETLNNNKLDKVTEANKVYGTNTEGEQVTYDANSFGKVDTVNGVTPDESKNVTLTSDDIMHTATDDTSSASIKNVLNTIITTLNSTVKASATKIQTYLTGTAYEAQATLTRIHPRTFEAREYLDTNRYVTFTRQDGVVLMAIIVNDFTSSADKATTYENFIADVEAGHLQLIGIPEQAGGTTSPSTDEQEAEQAHSILNEVDGISETYDGIGGTVAEAEQALDNILN